MYIQRYIFFISIILTLMINFFSSGHRRPRFFFIILKPKKRRFTPFYPFFPCIFIYFFSSAALIFFKSESYSENNSHLFFRTDNRFYRAYIGGPEEECKCEDDSGRGIAEDGWNTGAATPDQPVQWPAGHPRLLLGSRGYGKSLPCHLQPPCCL